MTAPRAHFEDDASTLRPRLLGLAYRILGDDDEAEDVVQDAYLRWQGRSPELSSRRPSTSMKSPSI